MRAMRCWIHAVLLAGRLKGSGDVTVNYYTSGDNYIVVHGRNAQSGGVDLGRTICCQINDADNQRGETTVILNSVGPVNIASAA